MHILREQEVNQDLAKLDVAWEKEDTFVFLPDKCALSFEWIQEQCLKIPPALRRGHFILLTSGSTGLPRLVIGSRKKAEALVKILHQIQDSQDAAEAIVVLPLTYCYAFINQWLWARQYRRKITLTRGFSDPDLMQKCLKSASSGLLCLVGAQVALLTEHFPGAVFPGVRRCHFAGSLFPQEKLTAIRRLFPSAEIFNNYGCAEAMPRLSIRRAQDYSDGNNIGRPLPGIVFKNNREGEILFKSPYGAAGYLDQGGYNPLSPETWISTGDRGTRAPDGSWIFSGRNNEVFKRYGEKISLPHLLDTVKTVWKREAVFYRESDAKGEPGCVLVLSPAPDALQLKKISRALSDRHSHAQWPLRIESAPVIPLLPNGKLDTGSLAKIALPADPPGPRLKSNKEKLKNLISEVFLLNRGEFHFKLRRTEVETWDSLGIVALAAGIKRVFGYPLSPAEAAGLKGVREIILWLNKKGVCFDV